MSSFSVHKEVSKRIQAPRDHLSKSEMITANSHIHEVCKYIHHIVIRVFFPLYGRWFDTEVGQPAKGSCC